MIHPAHAMLLATTRHRELVAEADEFRAAAAIETAAARTGAPAPDCRIPVPIAQQPQPCRPNPRQAAAGRRGSHDPGYALRGHRKPRAVR